MSTEQLSHRVHFNDIYAKDSVSLSGSLNDFPKTILLTGANGMLGNGLAVALRQIQNRDTRLILCSRAWVRNLKAINNVDSKLKFIVNEEISALEETVDLVIHTASPSNVTRINTFEELEMANFGILRKLEELNPKKIVYVSSGEVYKGGESDEIVEIETFSIKNFRDWYPIAKLQSENELKSYVDKSNSDANVIRLFHTFGPGVKPNDGRSFADIIWGAGIKQEIVLKSSGEQIRSFLYLSDAIDGILSIALSENKGFSITNLGSPVPVSIRSFAEAVATISKAQIKYNLEVDFPHSPNSSIVPNVDKLMLSGWRPQVLLEEAIIRTINWIRGSTL
jgi:nucleoside-diphosphate-sugar epimerase